MTEEDNSQGRETVEEQLAENTASLSLSLAAEASESSKLHMSSTVYMCMELRLLLNIVKLCLQWMMLMLFLTRDRRSTGSGGQLTPLMTPTFLHLGQRMLFDPTFFYPKIKFVVNNQS